MKFYTRIGLLILALTAALPINSENTYRFRTLSPKGGFYYDGVKAVRQDAEGFIWVLIENDLKRFDGYEYKSYYPQFRRLLKATRWNFYQIDVDGDGNLLAATTGGVYKYDKYSDSFDKLSDEPLARMAVDRSGAVWGVIRKQLCRLGAGGEGLPVLYEGAPVRHVNTIDARTDTVFLATLYNRIYAAGASRTTGSVSLFYMFPPDYTILGIESTESKLWVLLKDHGLVRIERATRRIDDRFDFFAGTGLSGSLVKVLTADRLGNLWIGTQKGLYVYNPVSRNCRLYRHSKSDRFSLPNNSVWSVDRDRQGNLWIGTFSGGLCYVNLDEGDRFRSYTPYESGLNHNLISCFAEDGDHLWIGTEGEGLNRLDRKTGTYVYYKHGPGNALAYDNIKSLAVDKDRNLWIAMFQGGLDCYDLSSGRFRHFTPGKEKETSLLSNSLRKIILEKDSGLWVAYQWARPAVSFYSFATERFSHYEFDRADSSQFVYDFWREPGGSLWIATSRKVYRMDTTDGSATDISSGALPGLMPRCLCTDSEGRVWIGTAGDGLVRYRSADDAFDFFPDLQKLNVSTVYSLCFDRAGCLWLGTDNGLVRYDEQAGSWLRFDEDDGLQGPMFYPLAALAASGGELYFGGTNGFTRVNPSRISQNLVKPNVIISDFLIDNVSALPGLKTGVSAGGRLTLKYTQANFGFTFSSDNYLIPEKNRFRYRLRGYDERWITVDASHRTALYSKVPPGSYYFDVQAANNDGVWNDRTLTIPIRRLPSPWLSWPAYLLYGLAAAGILALVGYHFREKRKLKMQLYLDALDREKKEEIHQSRLRFFTNISHDFRTPLSLILATVDNLRRDGTKENEYRLLHNNARRLLNLVNELMDFRTVENGKMPLQVQPVDLNRLVAEWSSDFREYARKHGIEFRIVCDEAVPPSLWLDRQVVEKIVMNLLNNAFKYTKEGGCITIETHARKEAYTPVYANGYTAAGDAELPGGVEPATGVLIVVRDTGIGISGESIASVFERFYQVKTVNAGAHLGTGIGLALVKSLVLLHKGSISIYSERERGTDMVVCLPGSREAYAETDFLREEERTERMVSEHRSGLARELSDVPGGNDEVSPEAALSLDEPLRLPERKRILVVEDNDDLCALLSDFLSEHYEVSTASNGQEASVFLEKSETDLIISDIMMPVKDGVTLCREVKGCMATSHIPFILLTARTGAESRLEGAGSGADRYFEKPVDLNLLLVSVQNMFRHQEVLREYYAKHYFAGDVELAANEQDNAFLEKLTQIIDANLAQPTIDVSFIASELSMSRSKLYAKLKTLTGKSIVEFVLNYRLRKAARLIIGQDLSMRQVMEAIGIRSQSYFTNAFKKEFGDTPTAFAAKHKKK